MNRDLSLKARRMGLRHVEHDARRAAARVERHLQVLDVVVEGGRVEGDAALRIFDAGFIVPERLILVGLEAAEGRKVARAAKRRVQRVVDAAETEALRDLRVDAEAVAGLPAHDPARREAARTGLVRAIVAVREDAARVEASFFMEVVPA